VTISLDCCHHEATEHQASLVQTVGELCQSPHFFGAAGFSGTHHAQSFAIMHPDSTEILPIFSVTCSCGAG